jgi:hypothetical protein
VRKLSEKEKKTDCRGLWKLWVWIKMEAIGTNCSPEKSCNERQEKHKIVGKWTMRVK